MTLTVEDQAGLWFRARIMRSNSRSAGPGEIVATDNGDPTDRTVFSSHDREAFSGKALVIVRALPGQPGEIVVSASADGLMWVAPTVVAQ